MCKGCCKCGCVFHWIIKILVVVGGVNWGLVGAGMLLGMDNLNIVKMLLGNWPIAEAAVYILVGVAAVVKLFCCGKCKKCEVEAPAVQTPQA